MLAVNDVRAEELGVSHVDNPSSMQLKSIFKHAKDGRTHTVRHGARKEDGEENNRVHHVFS